MSGHGYEGILMAIPGAEHEQGDSSYVQHIHCTASTSMNTNSKLLSGYYDPIVCCVFLSMKLVTWLNIVYTHCICCYNLV